jgi:succinate dehydrogenase / fumarate reductase iron-sulfur subunit
VTQRTFRVYRGTREKGKFKEYTVQCEEGMVVLDAIHRIQAEQAPHLACRWNCKAGKCGSCSAEVNGKPKLMCMTRLSDYPASEVLTITPMKAFPVLRDLVTDVSWNYQVHKSIPPFEPRPPDAPGGTWRMEQYEVERAQEFRKCIECFLCQDVCHVIRTHEKQDEFIGPAFIVRAAVYEMHPLNAANREKYLKEKGGLGYCNITKCCTEVCPENIRITDNAIIPLKERVADRYYDPVRWIAEKFAGKSKRGNK